MHLAEGRFVRDNGKIYNQAPMEIKEAPSEVTATINNRRILQDVNNLIPRMEEENTMGDSRKSKQQAMTYKHFK